MTTTPSRSGIITLLSDFGDSDTFVGVMKGVILGITPSAQLIDLTHQVPAHAIRSAAFHLACAAPYFPAGTVHVAVVDPGVGSDRRPIVAECRRGIYVAPDNGLLTLVLPQDEPLRVVAVENPAYRLPGMSATFHGRDVFAPVG
ncbi:MAG: SAM-dependent chlorinase/fluorinase, partial [Verrucomicrobia bacterium]|nr:SAM-dependent chlorinase/fluorinase [Verrucomicrobiota bacterium]